MSTVLPKSHEREEKYSRTTQLIRKDIYSNMKLRVSAYNGHLQVSIPIKGSLYI